MAPRVCVLYQKEFYYASKIQNTVRGTSHRFLFFFSFLFFLFFFFFKGGGENISSHLFEIASGRKFKTYFLVFKILCQTKN
jgi:hypothetical protein